MHFQIAVVAVLTSPTATRNALEYLPRDHVLIQQLSMASLGTPQSDKADVSKHQMSQDRFGETYESSSDEDGDELSIHPRPGARGREYRSFGDGGDDGDGKYDSKGRLRCVSTYSIFPHGRRWLF